LLPAALGTVWPASDHTKAAPNAAQTNLDLPLISFSSHLSVSRTGQPNRTEYLSGALAGNNMV